VKLQPRGRRRALRRSLAATALATALLAAGCGEEPVPAEPEVRPVKIMSVSSGGGQVLEFPGVISPAQQADMAFEVPGKVIEFPAQEAQRVARGTVLARLDPRDYESELDKARANMSKAETDEKRFQLLYDEGVNPLTDLERAQRRHEVARADFRTAAKALDDTYLKAPFDGVVARKLVEDFVNVKAKETVLILQDDSTLKVKVSLPERDFTRMTPGLTLEERRARSRPTVTISSLPNRSFPTWIEEFATTADPVTRTYQATFAFENPKDVTVLPGMTAKISVTIAADAGGRSQVTIPSGAAVADDDGRTIVWVVDPETMRVASTPVTLGGLSGSEVEVQRGLEGGEWIAISGVHELRDGIRVRRFEK
jgi:RND family efflux transporter MFP subunit